MVGEWDDFSRIDLEAQVSPEIFSRGFVYYREGHLLQAVRIGPTRTGLVAGTNGNYRASLWFEDGLLHTACNCPFQGFCKHLVAVALGWLTEPDIFRDLQPELDRVINQPQLLQDVATNLCHQEPFVFLNILSPAKETLNFQTSRGILNLVRNIFASPRQPLDQGEALWEQVKRLQRLLQQELCRGVPEALQPLTELIEGLATVYLDYPAEALSLAFQEMMAVIQELPSHYPAASLETFLILLLNVYFEPKLWEWKQTCGVGIQELSKLCPAVLTNYLGTKQLGELPTLEIISFYELLLHLESKPGGPQTNQFSAVEEELKGRADGLLWLIDRWLDEAPDVALRLARDGVRRLEPELTVNLKDRMVQLHWRQGELKQAAALSFALFRLQPSFEEYLRLKDILRDRPLELQEYRQKAWDFLKMRFNHESGGATGFDEGLLIRIAIAEGNCQVIRDYCAGPFQTPEIIREIAQYCLKEPGLTWRSVHPALIHSLLASDSPEMWGIARSMMVIYKKYCILGQTLEEWRRFSGEILRRYEDDRRFLRKFGALLNVEP